jgi:hypothetical protein
VDDVGQLPGVVEAAAADRVGEYLAWVVAGEFDAAIVIDGGKVFISDMFTRARERLGISVQRVRPRTPTDKASFEATPRGDIPSPTTPVIRR